jgi:hypothetical protein
MARSAAFPHRNSHVRRALNYFERQRTTAMTTETLTEQNRATPHIRTAHDASDDRKLARNPSDEDAKLDVALDETFPTSDAPSNTQPGKGKDPAPSSGYDEEAEKARLRRNDK